MLYARFSTYIMWFFASLFYFYQYILRVIPNIMMDEICCKYGLQAAEYGQFSGIYYGGYAIAHIPIGLALDRYGPKYVVPFCAFLTVIGTLPLIYSDLWWFNYVGRFMVGAGSAAAILGVFSIIRLAFRENMFSRMLGFSATLGSVGAIYGGQPVYNLMASFGWQNVIAYLALIGALLSFVLFVVIPRFEVTRENHGIKEGFKNVLANPRILIVCFLGGLMVGPVEGFADVWGASFLKTVYHLPVEQANFFPSLIFLGLCLGCPVLGYVADRGNMHVPLTIVCGLSMAFSFLFLLTSSVNALAMGLLFSIIGFFSAYQIFIIYLVTRSVGKAWVGLASAYANMIIMSFGLVFHTTIGALMDYFWKGATSHGIRIYDAAAYISSVSVIPIALLVSSVGFMYLKWRSKI